MNNDLISRSELLREIDAFMNRFADDTDRILVDSFIRNASAVDAEPVRHGKWFFDEYDYFTCSVCGGQYFTGADSTKDAKTMLENNAYYPYCPYCGARMDGGDK